MKRKKKVRRNKQENQEEEDKKEEKVMKDLVSKESAGAYTVAVLMVVKSRIGKDQF